MSHCHCGRHERAPWHHEEHHHGHEHHEGCSCRERHGEGWHGERYHPCRCHDRGCCCCREPRREGRHGGFERRFPGKAEEIAKLEAYLAELKAEAQGVEERLSELRR